MKINGQQLLRATILLFFTIFIFRLHVSGDILKLINPKYETLSQLGASLFLLLFLIQMHRVFTFGGKNEHHHHEEGDGHHHDHGDQPINLKKSVSYIIIFFPVATGILLPLASLDASIAKNKGSTLAITGQAVSESEESSQEEQQLSDDDVNQIDPNVYKNKITKDEYDQLLTDIFQQSRIDMNETLFSTYYQQIMQNPEQLQGTKVTLSGFVYREEDFSPQQFVMGRFLITHCVADASLIGFMMEFDQAVNIEDDTWLEVTGTIQLTEYQGSQLPIVQIENMETIIEPDQPYVYPINIVMVE
ncbi:putative membrane protein [Gracilibacillus orientalis]|uniref:Putative membrane protein n=1 Tax=Gracilibacillus orientalis TaxID=334253 RepID=A0A1I4IPX5_9BACI|nr:TIGR03943 family protein [Gracilibacillus orientalis]SFL56402.1 putative membrane protein [Gracilibacillus orientalis]